MSTITVEQISMPNVNMNVGMGGMAGASVNMNMGGPMVATNVQVGGNGYNQTGV